MRRILPDGMRAAIVVMTALWLSCASPPANRPADPPAATPALQPWEVQGIPAFPGNADPGWYSAVHQVSTAETAIPGADELAEEGENNYEDPGIQALVIAPGAEDDLAYAMYNLAGLGVDRPVNISIEVDSAPLLPGGDDPLPLHFWVGLSNYTQYAWEWFGPFEESQNLVLNNPQVLERYIGTSGILFYALVTLPGAEYESPANPDGLTACQINLGTVTTEDGGSAAYTDTKPLFTPIESHSPSSMPKGGSNLDPKQFVTLNWTHNGDAQCPDSAAADYQVYREGPGDAVPLLIGTTEAPAGSYVDPRDNQAGVDEPVPGWTYTYYLCAWNDQGQTAYDSITVTIPVLNNWSHTWGRDYEDRANSVLLDTDGDVYITGYTRKLDTGEGDLLLLGYDPDGNLKQAVAWGDPADHEEGWGICGDQAGNKYVSGLTRSLTGEQQLALVRFDADDVLVWDRCWNVGAGIGVNSSIGYAVACNTTGTEIFVVGSISEWQDNIALLKFNADGQVVTTPELWDGRWFDVAGGNCYGRAIAIGAAGDVYIAGEIITGIGNTDALVMHVKADNTLDWAKSWGTATNNDEALAVALDEGDGALYFSGWHNNNQVMAVRLNVNGGVDWQKSWTIPEATGQGNGIAVAGNSLYITGDIGLAGEFSLFVIELDKADGSLLSQRTWGSAGEVEAGLAVAASPDGTNVIAAGFGVAADGDWDVPNGQTGDVTAPEPDNVDMAYDAGLNLFMEPLFGVGLITGVEDTGGGNDAEDCLVLLFQP